MQAAVLRSRCGCTESDQKAWVRDGILVPISAGFGPGIHAEYDEANVLAAAIALRMKRAAVVVSRYAEAFAQLHAWLRARSALEWRRYQVVLTPEGIRFDSANSPLPTDIFGFRVGLEAVCATLQDSEQLGQLQLNFGLRLAG